MQFATTAQTRTSRSTPTRLLDSPKVLWTLQIALAAVFLFAGASKFVYSAEQMTGGTPFSIEFIRFIGTVEVLGALGLVLPGVTGIRRGLTPLAAAGLVIVMTGAVVTTVATGGPAAAALPLLVGLAAAAVVYGRRNHLQTRGS